MALLLLVVLSSAPGSSQTVAAGAESDLELTGDRIARRVAVPADGRRQGEVRIVQRDQEVVVQTVLHSKVLRRVAGEIAKKEARGWRDTSADSELFVAALRKIVNDIRKESRPEAGEDAQRYRNLRIDFFVSDGRGRVVLSGAEVEDDGTTLRLVALRSPVESLELSTDYVRRNMSLIVADSFGTTFEEAERLLAAAE
jgi:hypothetical protein